MHHYKRKISKSKQFVIFRPNPSRIICWHGVVLGQWQDQDPWC
ncbi:hypothetical protein [Moraxella lacunata]